MPESALDFERAQKYADDNDPAGSLNKYRIVLERLVQWIYETEIGELPRKRALQHLIDNTQFQRVIPERVKAHLNLVRGLGNTGSHGQTGLTRADAKTAQTALLEVLEWFMDFYGSRVGGVPPAPGVELPAANNTAGGPVSSGWQRIAALVAALAGAAVSFVLLMPSGTNITESAETTLAPAGPRESGGQGDPSPATEPLGVTAPKPAPTASHGATVNEGATSGETGTGFEAGGTVEEDDGPQDATSTAVDARPTRARRKTLPESTPSAAEPPSIVEDDNKALLLQ